MGWGSFPVQVAGTDSAQATSASIACGMDQQGSKWVEDSHLLRGALLRTGVEGARV